MNTRELRGYKASLEMTPRQASILDGTLLGDGHLERQRGALVARLKIEHSVKQFEYIEWLYAEWRAWVRTPPRERNRRSGLGTVSRNIGFSTLSHDAFEAARLRFYRDGRKTVPGDLQLSPLSLAVWFMDDGSRKSRQCRGIYFNTQSFTLDDVNLLRRIMRREVGVETTVRQQRDGMQIYVPARAVPELVGFLDGNVLPSMRYKLPG